MNGIITNIETETDVYEITLAEERPFMETSLDDYTVTEGLLLLLVVLVLCKWIYDGIRRLF